MALAFDSSGQQLNSGSTTNSFSFNNVAGNLLIVGCVDDAISTISVTYNGVSMTSVGSTNDGSGFVKVQLFYLMSPATGSNTLTATRTTGTGGFAVHAVSYSGAGTASQPDSFNTGSNSSTSLTVSTTVVNPNSWLVGIWTANSGSLSAGTGATARGADSGASGQIGATRFFDSNGTVGTGSQSMTVNMTSGSNGAVMMSIKAPNQVTLTMANGTLVITGFAMAFQHILTMVKGTLTLTGFSATLTAVRKWVMATVNTSSWSNSSQNTSTMTTQNKSADPTWTNQNQN